MAQARSAPLASRSAPTAGRQRITSIDAVRGVAVLGILAMNVVSFGLPDAAYHNIDATSPQTWLDWMVGAFGEVFFDQKFMAIFSMLFGAGIVLFAERAKAKGARPVLLSLWRNGLLLGIGVLHSMLWDGDILVVYAVLAPVVLALRRIPDRTLVVIGIGVLALSPLMSLAIQSEIPASGEGLGSLWGVEGAMSQDVEFWLLADAFARALGMMLIGIALFRSGFLSGMSADATYRRTAWWGLGVGLPISALGFVWVASTGFDPSVALVGTIPNTVATLPIALGYIALVVLWNDRNRDSFLAQRIRAVGRMALTNYISQSVLGVVVLGGVLGGLGWTRSSLVVFVIAVWVLQLWWSKAWLDRFRFGPLEWLWRVCTYRTWTPLRPR